MCSNTIDVRSIASLSGMNFYIPDYQRGYRWTPSQAIQMLSDFEEFCKRKDQCHVQLGEYYCLQPIVVKEGMDRTKSRRKRRIYRGIRSH